MRELRTMRLYKKRADVPAAVLVNSRDYEFTTLAAERQIADDLAAIHGLRKDEGYIKIWGVINELGLEP